MSYQSSVAARAGVYRELMPDLDPERIGFIPPDIMDALAVKYEREAAATRFWIRTNGTWLDGARWTDGHMPDSWTIRQTVAIPLTNDFMVEISDPTAPTAINGRSVTPILRTLDHGQVVVDDYEVPEGAG